MDQFLGEIKIMSFMFAPKGWMQCNGQLLPINQNQALFSLLGTTYGGDGRVNFGVPNLQGRIPFHLGNGFVQGAQGGETAHTLNVSELPAHTHIVTASSNAATQNSANSPSPALWANGARTVYASTPNAVMNPASVSTNGGSQPHENRPPYLVLNFCIAIQGIFPSQN
jgi:microcystin-dependent protein